MLLWSVFPYLNELRSGQVTAHVGVAVIQFSEYQESRQIVKVHQAVHHIADVVADAAGSPVFNSIPIPPRFLCLRR